MGKKNRERRAAKAKQRAQDRARHAHRSGPDPSQSLFTEAERISMLLDAAADARLHNDPTQTAELVRALGRADERLLVREAGGELRRVLPRLWDAGWQPAELVRQARRDSARTGRLAAAAVLADHADRRVATFDPRWLSQVDELAACDEAARTAATGDWLATFAARETLRGEVLAAALVDGLAACLGVGPLPILIPPPGTSRSTSSGADWAHGPPTGDDKVLARVRTARFRCELRRPRVGGRESGRAGHRRRY